MNIAHSIIKIKLDSGDVHNVVALVSKRLDGFYRVETLDSNFLDNCMMFNQVTRIFEGT